MAPPLPLSRVIPHEASWRNPSANPADYFNYDMNETGWRHYCSRVKTYRDTFNLRHKIQVLDPVAMAAAAAAGPGARGSAGPGGGGGDGIDTTLPPEVVAALRRARKTQVGGAGRVLRCWGTPPPWVGVRCHGRLGSTGVDFVRIACAARLGRLDTKGHCVPALWPRRAPSTASLSTPARYPAVRLVAKLPPKPLPRSSTGRSGTWPLSAAPSGTPPRAP